MGPWGAPLGADGYGTGLAEAWREGRDALAPKELVLDGRRITYVECGTGEPACILLHGIANTWRFWTAVAPALAAGRRVVALDLPGFGGSDPLDGDLTAPAAASAVIEACDALGIGHLSVVGHSMGALVALAMATARPERVVRVVVVGGALLGVLDLYASARHVVRHPLRALRLVSVVVQGAFPAPGWLLDEVARWRALRYLTLRPYLRWPGRLASEPLRDCLEGVGRPAVLAAARNAGRFDLAGAAHQVAGPVLVINGDGDRLSPPSDALRLSGLFDDGRLELVAGAAHWPMIERHQQVARLIADFLGPEDHAVRTGQ